MKKKILLLMGVFAFGLLQAQIGVNTENPQALFHIDGASTPATTNPSTGVPSATQIVDDVVVTNDGRVGIGTLNPSTNLEIVTGGTQGNVIKGFKLVDGGQEERAILVRNAGSDEAFWTESISKFESLPESRGSNLAYTVNNDNITVVDTGITINFPRAGTYFVNIGMQITDTNTDVNNRVYSAQLMPTNNIANWNSAVNRYKGGFETLGKPVSNNVRLYMVQALVVPPGSLTAHLLVSVQNQIVAGSISVTLGSLNAGNPQVAGGSYLRIH